MEQAAQATYEDLTSRCGHECLNRPDHDGPHFYGYQMGRYSYEGLLAENERLRAAAEFVLSQGEPCDRCAEDDCDPDRFCPCDYGCHNGAEAAHMALRSALDPAE